MKYIFAASLFAAAVSAQGFSDIPPCAIGCAAQNLPLVTKCKPGLDNIQKPEIQACLCDSPEFQEAFAKCAQAGETCDTKAKCDLYDVSKGICKDKLTVKQPAECAAPPATTTAAPPVETTTAPAPPAETTTEAAPPAETTGATTAAPAPGETSAAPPSYGGGSTVATEPSSAAGGAASGAPVASPTFAAGASNVVVNGAAALFAGLLAVLAL